MKDYIKKNVCTFRLKAFLLTMLLTLFCGVLTAQAQTKEVTGTVTDEKGDPLPGVTVVVEGTTTGSITDLDGNFRVSIPSSINNPKLVFSFVGYQTLTMAASDKLSVVLSEDTAEIEEVVVVGYGQQKKASVVGAITQTSGKVLERAGGISNVGAALTGNLPGVVTTQSTGQPGEEDPKIQIRGVSSWNNSEPLVLVDGVERSMSSVDISSVQSISVLKDASATAVYGVKGANGVILVTTKRGQEGSAKIDAGFSTTLKTISKLPSKMDSYDALMARNEIIEHELGVTPSAWNYIRSQEFINNYRNQTTTEQRERYPNVDWQDYLYKDAAVSYNAYVNVSGGSKFVKYYAAVDYVNEGDLYDIPENGRAYSSEFAYQRINVRSNLDFNITKTTVFKVNLSGSNGIRHIPWRHMHYGGANDTWQQAQAFASAFSTPPDVFLPRYSDGSWGVYPDDKNLANSAVAFALGGSAETSTTQVNTDFILEQNLDQWVKGLNLRAFVSMDNSFLEHNRGINDMWNDPATTYINPLTGEATKPTTNGNPEKFRYFDAPKWGLGNGEIDNWKTSRRLYYQAQVNYNRKFDEHNLGAMAMFSRSQNAYGPGLPINREDWAFRVTYDWRGKYFLEYNGAYNGSQKFGSDYRFAFFSSGAIGWLISGEEFMKNLVEKHIVENLKIRASVGQIGDDNIPNVDYLYMDLWKLGGNAYMNAADRNQSKYQAYYQSQIGNPEIHWEKVTKTDVGIDYSFLGGLLAGSFDIFRDRRTDIILKGDQRAIPNYFGATPATVNLGEVKNKGYEVELRVEKSILSNKLRLWGNFNMTHNENEVVFKDDIEGLPSYQKAEGYQIGQTRSHIDAGFLNNYDEVFGSPAHNSNDQFRMPGDLYIVDFNGDGIVDNEDSAPYAHPNVPQNTYNATVGAEYKGFSFFVQFYGVTNVSRYIGLTSFNNMLDNAYDYATWWSMENPNADLTTPRFASQNASDYAGTQYTFDGSYIRLKNIELAYSWNGGWIKKLGMSYLKVYVNGNNLWLWTRTPDDREINDNGQTASYPSVRRFNFGFKLSF